MEIVIDTREQTPLVFPDGVPTSSGTLAHGDYSIKGLTDLVAVERKSLPDFIACVGRERDRFVKELLALRGYKCKSVVIEATAKQLYSGGWRGMIKPEHAIGSIHSWRNKYGIEFIYAGNHELAALEVYNLLRKFNDYCAEFAKRFNT